MTRELQSGHARQKCTLHVCLISSRCLEALLIQQIPLLSSDGAIDCFQTSLSIEYNRYHYKRTTQIHLLKTSQELNYSLPSHVKYFADNSDHSQKLHDYPYSNLHSERFNYHPQPSSLTQAINNFRFQRVTLRPRKI